MLVSLLALVAALPYQAAAAPASPDQPTEARPERAFARQAEADTVRGPKQDLRRVEFGLSAGAGAGTFRTIAGRDYLLGAHDEIEVSIVGPKPDKNTVVVSPGGGIALPLVGAVDCAGLTVAGLEAKLTAAYERYLKNFTLTVRVTRLRGIEVTISGQVQAPGSYSLTGLSRLWDAIQRAGGLTQAGSVRGVRVRPLVGPERTVDLYPFFFSGRDDENIVLEAGTTLYVPVAERVIGLAGEVRRPGLYEFRAGETLAQLLALAGGANAEAALAKAYIERALSDQTKQITPLDLTRGDAAAQALRDGDVLVVPALRLFLGQVRVQGEVRQPGAYERKQNMRLCDLVDLAGGCKASAALGHAYIERFQGNEKAVVLFVDIARALRGDARANIPLEEGDTLRVPDIAAFTGTVTARGEVKRPLIQTLAEGMTVRDLVEMAGGPKAGAALHQAYLERFAPAAEGGKARVWIDLAKALANDPKHNLVLADGDVLNVMPASIYYGKVSVSGEVRLAAAPPAPEPTAPGEEGGSGASGASLAPSARPAEGQGLTTTVGQDAREQKARALTFDLVQGMRVSDLLRLAGGPMATAALSNARLVRIRPDGLQEMARIDLRAIQERPGGPADLALRDGDSLNVPSISILQQTVRVSGELVGTGIFEGVPGQGGAGPKRRGIYALKEGDTVRDMVLAVGGVTANAAMRAARIERTGAGAKVERIAVDLYKLIVERDASADVPLRNGDEFIVPAIAELVYVVGCVNQPGAYDYREGDNRVMSMISRAGGMVTGKASPSGVTVVRTEPGGDRKPIKVNMELVMRGRIEQDIAVRPGDIIHVPQKFVYLPDVFATLANISLLQFYLNR